MSDMSAELAAHRQVGFVEAVTLYLGNYFTFEGRSSRGASGWGVNRRPRVDDAKRPPCILARFGRIHQPWR